METLLRILEPLKPLLGIVEILGFILSIIALVVGIRHIREIHSIRSAMPTHPIGPFPKCFRHIASLIEKANKEIIILCDFPAYGSLLASHDFLHYRQMIEQKIDQGLDIKITYLDYNPRVKLINELFSKGWETRKKRPDVQGFLSAHHPEVNVETLEFNQFSNFIEEQNQRMLQMFHETSSKSKPITNALNAHVPIYFWIVDDTAIFTIPIFSRGTIEQGFQTSDRDIIKGFKAIRERYIRTSAE